VSLASRSEADEAGMIFAISMSILYCLMAILDRSGTVNSYEPVTELVS
jgi:hypothetical protein